MSHDIWTYVVVLLGLGSLWRARYLFRGGAMKEGSLEWKQAITELNQIRWLRGQPKQRELTRAQMRAYGWRYAVIGGIVFLLGVLLAFGILK